jgi:hypothetical protein
MAMESSRKSGVVEPCPVPRSSELSHLWTAKVHPVIAGSKLKSQGTVCPASGQLLTRRKYWAAAAVTGKETLTGESTP